MTIGVIISTYNNPEWLVKTLRGYSFQTRPADEIIIADDGSGPETKAAIEMISQEIGMEIKHVWHPDDGFRKCEILNKAVMASESEYLIFTDQDCIPRGDFVATHFRNARRGRFVSGGYFRLPAVISSAIIVDDIASQRAFSLKWLRKHGLKISFKVTKLISMRWFSALMNFITPSNASWNGCNASTWRDYIIAANGFNTEMCYGGQDREFGERLMNSGIRGLQRRYSAILLHLDHDRPYVNREAIEKNLAIRHITKKKKLTKTTRGIENINIPSS